MYTHYTSTYKHPIENENEKNKLVSQYIKGLFLHEHLHRETTCKLLWFYIICHFCSFDKNEATIRVVGKKTKHEPDFLCLEDI